MSEDSRQPDGNQEEDLELALAKVERDLFALKQRITQVEQDQERKEQLQQREQELKQQQQDKNSREPIKTELHYLKQELEAIELNLESRLLSWSSFQEPFWQAVRFGGLGIVIGWLLKSCAG